MQQNMKVVIGFVIFLVSILAIGLGLGLGLQSGDGTLLKQTEETKKEPPSPQ